MPYVKIDPKGTRLGNWMFQVAAAKTACPDEPITFVIEDEEDWAAVQKYGCLWGEVSYTREAPAGAVVREGLYQDAANVDRELSRKLYLGGLREAFEKSREEKKILPAGDLVSIHVRRGDYLRLPHRHPFVGERYLREAVERFPNAEFLICSDDIPWCRRFFKGPRFHFSEGTSVLDDLYLMTQCRGGHICSNSTFSWWGAFLGEGRTIFPSMWYGLAIKNADWQGLYFDGSEVVTNRYSLGLWLKAWFCIVKTKAGDIARRLGIRKR